MPWAIEVFSPSPGDDQPRGQVGQGCGASGEDRDDGHDHPDQVTSRPEWLAIPARMRPFRGRTRILVPFPPLIRAVLAVTPGVAGRRRRPIPVPAYKLRLKFETSNIFPEMKCSNLCPWRNGPSWPTTPGSCCT